MTEQGTGDTHNCEKDGHCLHEGAAVISLWCCECHKYIDPGTLGERLNFYERSYDSQTYKDMIEVGLT